MEEEKRGERAERRKREGIYYYFWIFRSLCELMKCTSVEVQSLSLVGDVHCHVVYQHVGLLICTEQVISLSLLPTPNIILTITISPLPTSPHSSLLTPHSSLLTPHSSLLTPHSFPFHTSYAWENRYKGIREQSCVVWPMFD